MPPGAWNSLVDILGPARLAAKPTLWTPEYLHLLEISFEDVEYVDELSGKTIPKRCHIGEHNYAKKLVKKAPPSSKRAAFTTLITSAETRFSHHCDSPPLCFAGYVAHRPNYSLYKSNDRAVEGPWLGYFHHGREVPLNELSRWASYDRFPAITTLPKHSNDWTRHPYFVCILLSMAQAQRSHLKPGQRDCFTSRLFVTDDQDTEFLHMFEATMPCKFLDMVDKPNIPMEVPKIPRIKHKTIPLKPGKTLRDRVIAEGIGLTKE
jgi:hypothetical protein